MGLRLRCERCAHTWEYTGKKNLQSTYMQYTSCPACKTSVPLQERKRRRVNRKRHE